MNSPEDAMLMERDLEALDAALSAGVLTTRTGTPASFRSWPSSCATTPPGPTRTSSV